MPSFPEFSKLDREGPVQGGKPFPRTPSQDTSEDGLARPVRLPEKPGGLDEVLRFVSFPFYQAGGYFDPSGVSQHCSGQYVYKEKGEEGCSRAGRLQGKDFFLEGWKAPGLSPREPTSKALR